MWLSTDKFRIEYFIDKKIISSLSFISFIIRFSRNKKVMTFVIFPVLIIRKRRRLLLVYTLGWILSIEFWSFVPLMDGWIDTNYIVGFAQ